MKLKTYCNGEERNIKAMHIGVNGEALKIAEDGVVYDVDKFIVFCKLHGISEEQCLKYINENSNKKEGNENG